MYEDSLKIIDKIKLEKQIISEEEETLLIKSYLDAKEIQEICEILTDYNAVTFIGWDFFFNYLDKDRYYKLFWFLFKMARADVASPEIKLVCELSLLLLRNILRLPCEIANIEEEEGYLEAIDQTLDFYLPKEEFENAHQFTHEVLEGIVQSREEDGFIRKLHLN